MAFADVGAYCSMPLCRQQDFLPFTCTHCKGVFCMEHRESGRHNCTVDLSERGKMPICPVCSQTVKIKAEDAPDAIVNRHILSGCKSDVFDVQLEKRKMKDAKPCAYKTCHNPEKFDIVTCTACGLAYCLTHRHQDTHNCPHLRAGATAKRGNSAASRLLDKIAEKKAMAAATNPPQQPTVQPDTKVASTQPAAGAALRSEKEQAAARMRLKMRAKGDASVKEHQRFFLEILFPQISITGAPVPSRKPESMWFDINWTVGRVVDKIASSCGLENRNHEATARKLQLTSVQSQAVFPHDVALNLLIPELRSGDTVQLVYT